MPQPKVYRNTHPAVRAAAAEVEESAPLERLSKNELYEIANEAEIVGRSSMTKVELIKAIKGE
jgi:hypothetical protein